MCLEIHRIIKTCFEEANKTSRSAGVFSLNGICNLSERDLIPPLLSQSIWLIRVEASWPFFIVDSFTSHRRRDASTCRGKPRRHSCRQERCSYLQITNVLPIHIWNPTLMGLKYSHLVMGHLFQYRWVLALTVLLLVFVWLSVWLSRPLKAPLLLVH